MANEQQLTLGAYTWTANGSQSGYSGVKITVGSANMVLNSVTKYLSHGALTCYVGTTSQGSEAGTATFAGVTATFATALTLSANTDYYLTLGSGGAGYASFFDDPTYNQPSRSEFDWISGIDQNGNGGQSTFGVVSLNFGIKKHTVGEKELKTDWDELTASDSTKAVGHKQTLVAEKGTFVPRRKRVGI